MNTLLTKNIASICSKVTADTNVLSLNKLISNRAKLRKQNSSFISPSFLGKHNDTPAGPAANLNYFKIALLGVGLSLLYQVSCFIISYVLDT